MQGDAILDAIDKLKSMMMERMHQTGESLPAGAAEHVGDEGSELEKIEAKDGPTEHGLEPEIEELEIEPEKPTVMKRYDFSRKDAAPIEETKPPFAAPVKRGRGRPRKY